MMSFDEELSCYLTPLDRNQQQVGEFERYLAAHLPCGMELATCG